MLHTAAQAAQEAGNQALGPLGLSVKHFGLLTFLRHETGGGDEFHERLTGGGGTPALSQHAVGERLRIDRTTMVALVDELERMGYLRRERNPSDRRAYVLTLTPQGEAAQRRAEEELDRLAETFFAPLSREERGTLFDLLVRLVERSG